MSLSGKSLAVLHICLFNFLSSVHVIPFHIYNAFVVFSYIDVLASRGLILTVWLPLKVSPFHSACRLFFSSFLVMRVIALEQG